MKNSHVADWKYFAWPLALSLALVRLFPMFWDSMNTVIKFVWFILLPIALVITAIGLQSGSWTLQNFTIFLLILAATIWIGSVLNVLTYAGFSMLLLI
jgi:hypothetical protein